MLKQMATAVCRQNSACQVVYSLAGMIKSLLGPNSGLKCIIEEDGEHSMISGCPAELMQSLDVQHAMYYVINSAVQTHHEVQGTSCKTLIVMSGFLLSAMEDLMQSGIRVSDVLLAFHVGLDYCNDCVLESPVIVSFDSHLNELIQPVSTPLTGHQNLPTACNNSSSSHQFQCPEDDSFAYRSTGCVQNTVFYEAAVCKSADTIGGNVDEAVSSRLPLAAEDNDDDDDVSWFFEGESGVSARDVELVKSVCQSTSLSNKQQKSPDSIDGLESAINKYIPFVEQTRQGISVINSNGVDELNCDVDKECSCEVHIVNSDQSSCNSLVLDSASISPALNVDRNEHHVITDEVAVQCVPRRWLMSSEEKTLPSPTACRLTEVCVDLDKQQTIHNSELTLPELEQKRTDLSTSLNCWSFSKTASKNLAFSSNFLSSVKSKKTGVVSCDSEDSSIKYDCVRDRRVIDLYGKLRLHGMRLSHGCDSMMALAIEMCYRQMVITAGNGFNLNLVHTLHIAEMPSNRTSVVNGCLLRAPGDQLTLLSTMTTRQHHALLVNGDVSLTHRHQGYQKLAGVNVVRRTVDAASNDERWLSEIMEVIAELGVTCLFIKGTASSMLTERCRHDDVIVVTGVSYRALVAIAESTRTELCTYITECCQRNVVRGISVEPWRTDWMDTISLSHYIVVSPSTGLLQSAVICHPVADVAHTNEEKLKHCLRRLRGMLASRRVLRGAGCVELYCGQKLEQLADRAEKSEDCLLKDAGKFAVPSLRAMSEAFKSFHRVVTTNIQSTCPLSNVGDVVYDDYEAKLASWRSALYIACLIVNTDMEVVVSHNANSMNNDSIVGYL